MFGNGPLDFMIATGQFDAMEYEYNKSIGAYDLDAEIERVHRECQEMINNSFGYDDDEEGEDTDW